MSGSYNADAPEDPYEVLGLHFDGINHVSQEDIMKAYRKLSLQLHPDKARDSDGSAFRQLVAAKDIKGR